MRIKEHHTLVERSNTGAEQIFTIKATSKAFQILSSGLYSNKILAIVRELSCNAYDAHVAAGNTNQPIEIKLPNAIDPVFYVKDFGTGLAHEDVLSIYTTYFESTKQNCNESIGALGLGSKSPFSYASNFTVESRFNQEKRIYTCFINDYGNPSITMMYCDATDEPNGMTISVSVAPNDCDRFVNMARVALMYFDPTPVIIGVTNFTPYPVSYTISGSIWRCRLPSAANMHGPRVIQGFISYPIDVELLRDRGLSALAWQVANSNIDILVQIGDVDIAPSREALSYDPDTIKVLVSVLEQVANEIHSSIQSKYNECTTLWEVGLLHNKMGIQANSRDVDVYNSLYKAKPFTWNGVDIKEQFTIKYNQITQTSIHIYALGSHNRLSSKRVSYIPGKDKEITLQISSNLYILVDHKPAGNTWLYKEYLLTLPNSARLLVIKPTAMTGYDFTEIDTVLKLLGTPPYKVVSNLPFKKHNQTIVGSKTTLPRKTKHNRLKWVGMPDYSSRYTRKCWNVELMDVDLGGYYIEVEKYAPVRRYKHINIEALIARATELGLIIGDITIWGLTANECNEIAFDDNWVDITTHITELFHEHNEDDKFSDVIMVSNMRSCLPYTVVLQFFQEWHNIKTKIPQGAFYDYISKYAPVLSQPVNNNISYNTITSPVLSQPVNNNISYNTITSLMSILSINTSNDMKMSFDYAAEWYDVLSNYPMLTLVPFSNIRVGNHADIFDYIRLVEQNKRVELSQVA
jgi:hypothetical protein